MTKRIILLFLFQASFHLIYGQQGLNNYLNLILKDTKSIDFLDDEIKNEDLNQHLSTKCGCDINSYPVCKNLFTGIKMMKYGVSLSTAYYDDVCEGLAIYCSDNPKFDDSTASKIEMDFFIDSKYLKKTISSTTTKIGFLFIKLSEKTKTKNVYSSDFFNEIFVKLISANVDVNCDTLNARIKILEDSLVKCVSMKINCVKDKITLDSALLICGKFNNLTSKFTNNPNDSVNLIFSTLYNDSIFAKNARILKLKADSVSLVACNKNAVNRNLIIDNLKTDLSSFNSTIISLNDTITRKKNQIDSCSIENKRLDDLLNAADADIRILNKIDLLNIKFDALFTNLSLPSTTIISSSDTLQQKPILLKKIDFETNRYHITDSYRNMLSKLADSLNVQKFNKLLIIGYADTIGYSDYNLLLSELRAKTVQVFLFENNIDINKIETIGAGELGENKQRKVEIYLYR